MPEVDPIKGKVIIEYDGSGVEAAKRDLSSLADIVGGSLAESTGGANDALSSLDEQMGKSAESTGTLTTALAPLPKTLQTAGESVTAVSEVLGEHQAAIEDASTAYESIQRPIEDTTALLESVAPPMLSITQHAEAMQEQLSPVNDGFVQISESLAQSVPLLPQFAESLHTVSAQLDPRELGLNTASENLAVFQDALANPYPYQLINQYLSETGQTWDDFSSSIGSENAAFLDQMAAMPVVSEKAFSTVSGGVENMGQTFYEAAGSTEEFNKQWADLAAGIEGVNKSGGVGAALYGPSDTWSNLNNALASTEESINKFGGVGSALYGPEEAMSLGDIFGSIGGSFGGVLDSLHQIAMPMMAVQMIGMAISSVSSGIYNMAALAEGPAAHSIGSFTGAVDVMGQHMQQVGEQSAESFGKGIQPMLDAINNMSGNGGGGNDFWSTITGAFGSGLSLFGNLGQIVAGGIVDLGSLGFTLNPSNPTGNSWIQSGWEGLQNMWAQITGAPEPFPTPGVAGSSVDATAVQGSIASSIAMMNAQANSPGYLAAQAFLQSQGAYAAQGQAAYDYSHYTGKTPFDYTPQSYQNAAIYAALHGGPTDGIDPVALNAAYFNSFPWNPGGSGGCFPAGTPVLLADSTEKAIETLCIGDRVAAHDGTKQVATTVMALITPPPKQVYELAFSNGHTLTLTDSHPIATIAGWKSISPASTKQENPDLAVTQLHPGDYVHTIKGTCMLLSIEPRTIVQVYNITVGEPHTFYAGRVLVHNKAFGTQIMQNVADSNVPTMDMKNSNLIQSMMSNFTSADLTHTFTASVTWEAQNLTQQYTAAVQWAANGLTQAYTAVVNWASQGLTQGFTAVANWASQGLTQGFTAIANWASQGLTQAFTAVANWIGQGLEKDFTGVANWIGQNLEHTFTGIANWSLQQITQVVGTIPGFASGVEGFQGGLAVVGEHGPELVHLEKGSSVYPQSSLTGSSLSSIFQNNAAPAQGGDVHIYFQVGGNVIAHEIIPQLAPMLRTYRGVRQ